MISICSLHNVISNCNLHNVISNCKSFHRAGPTVANDLVWVKVVLVLGGKRLCLSKEQRGWREDICLVHVRSVTIMPYAMCLLHNMEN